jgi:DNA-binding CsgD family transcriptional regulator
MEVAAIRLLPNEAAALVGKAEVLEAPDEPEFLALVASGLAAEAIARRVHSAPRSVYRRLARLRNHFGVQTTAELVAELSRRGY